MRRAFIQNNIIRNMVTRKYIMFTILTFIFVLFLTITLFNNVQAKSEAEYNKVYVSIEIKSGDTLSSYAERYAVSPSDYDEYIEELRYINNLKDDTLYAGCYLLIPVYDLK